MIPKTQPPCLSPTRPVRGACSNFDLPGKAPGWAGRCWMKSRRPLATAAHRNWVTGVSSCRPGPGRTALASWPKSRSRVARRLRAGGLLPLSPSPRRRRSGCQCKPRRLLAEAEGKLPSFIVLADDNGKDATRIVNSLAAFGRSDCPAGNGRSSARASTGSLAVRARPDYEACSIIMALDLSKRPGKSSN